MRVLNSSDEIASAAGTTLGTSEWLEVTQDRIDAFADATGDHQWIHVDPQKALEGPYGSTIAHGYLTLSLVPLFGSQVFAFAGDAAKVNYGLNKVRFPAPVPVGSKVRGHVALGDVVDIPTGQQVTIRYTIEIQGSDKPACVAETVVLLLGS
ncbi:acyl dehydratase [Mumia flava]|uniref:Acyl dehydratase n=1 Tax=Mumia flava TaxID=1348852 RepID=A0A0B2BI06_9ACTN|nr:MaoC family dehydratase [Mumia flava]PJJ58476.1 acyl dehydratase [Mumia flava]